MSGGEKCTENSGGKCTENSGGHATSESHHRLDLVASQAILLSQLTSTTSLYRKVCKVCGIKVYVTYAVLRWISGTITGTSVVLQVPLGDEGNLSFLSCLPLFAVSLKVT